LTRIKCEGGDKRKRFLVIALREERKKIFKIIVLKKGSALTANKKYILSAFNDELKRAGS